VLSIFTFGNIFDTHTTFRQLFLPQMVGCH